MRIDLEDLRYAAGLSSAKWLVDSKALRPNLSVSVPILNFMYALGHVA